MSSKINSLTVVFETDLCEEDVQRVSDAILLLKGVISVDANITDYNTHVAYSRAKMDFRDKLWDVLYPKS